MFGENRTSGAAGVNAASAEEKLQILFAKKFLCEHLHNCVWKRFNIAEILLFRFGFPARLRCTSATVAADEEREQKEELAL